MLPWSVMPIAGWPSAAAAATSSSSRAAPSSIENSVWTWRWVKDRPLPPLRCSLDRGSDRRSNHSDVIRDPDATPIGRRSGARRAAPLVRDRCRSLVRAAARAGRTGPSRRRHRAAGGSWRICSSCWRAASCWANSVAWMPWNRPSSQPTSWAWATRSSASVGTRRRRTARASGAARPAGRATAPRPARRPKLVDPGQPLPAGSSSGAGAHLVEQLLDHRADAHHLGRLLDRLGSSDRVVGLRRCGGADDLAVLGPFAGRASSLMAASRLRDRAVPSGPSAGLSAVTRPSASSGTSISAAVSEPWRQTSANGPVSAGSSKPTGSRATSATSPSAPGTARRQLWRRTSPRRPVCSRVTTQATSP